MGSPQLKASDRRLESWKEIAAFFGRDERTVRRWEKECSLPVHRVPGGAKGRVFAFEGELSQWLSTPQAVAGTEASAETPSDPALPAKLPGGGMVKWAALIAVCLLLAIGVAAYRRSHRFVVAASGTGAQTPPRRVSPEAEDFYLKGRYYWNQRTPESLNQAVDYFTQAIVRDPGYADAYVGLADCYNLLREFGAMPPKEAYPRAQAAAQKAVELNPDSAEAHASLAFADFWGFIRVDDAELEFKRALALEPRNAHIHHWHATFLAELGQFEHALAEIDTAQKLDPSSTAMLADKGFILAISGNSAEAIPLLKQLEATHPEFLSAHSYLSGTYFDIGEYGQYFKEAVKLAQLRHDTDTLNTLEQESKAFAAGGARALLEAKLQEDLRLREQGATDDFIVARDYALLDKSPEALRYLEHAYQNHDLGLCTLRVNWSFKGMHDDPGFRSLLAKVGLPALE